MELYTSEAMRKLLVLAALVAVCASQAVSDVPDKARSEFVFARVQFSMDARWIFDYREAPWHHDYPFSEDFYLNLVKEVTGINTNAKSYQVVQLDSPELFKYPLAYVSEPGYLQMTNREVANLREYLNRGGFIVCDDFRGRDLTILRAEMKRVFPDREMFRLDISHPVFHSFYDIDSLMMEPPYYDSRFLGGGPEFWGMNDDKGRLIMIGNHNNDLGEFWEWVDRGEMPFNPARKSVRLGINYLVYAITH